MTPAPFTSASLSISHDPALRYLLRLGDTCLVMAQRLAEWCGHAPVPEEDIALSNMALDLLGQARGVLTLAGARSGGVDEDQLAYLRDERDVLNPTLVELPRGDFAVTVLRNFVMACWLEPMWRRLQASADAELAAIAAKAVKEARYHRQHAGDWVLRLGDGTAESKRRLQAAVHALWPYLPELFESDDVDAHAESTGLGPAWSALEADWSADVLPLLADCGMTLPAARAFRSAGKRGRHSEHMGYLLAEMQHLHRSFPGGAW